jgi:hypothetical protein
MTIIARDLPYAAETADHLTEFAEVLNKWKLNVLFNN